MVERVEAKKAAKAQLKGNWGPAVLAFFVVSLAMMGINLVSNLIPFVGWIIPFALMGVWPFGMAFYSLAYANNQGRELGDIFSGFNYFKKVFCLAFLTGLFTFLWSLLLVIPGIIKAYSYSMAFYILAENPELSASEALDRSKEITVGNKGGLFITDLSFIGWGFLSTLTLGIGYLWLVPYIYVTRANIYNQIKGASTTVNDNTEAKSNYEI